MRRGQRDGVGPDAHSRPIFLMQLSLEALNIASKSVIGAIGVCVCRKSRPWDVRKPPTGGFASKGNEAYNGKKQIESNHSQRFIEITSAKPNEEDGSLAIQAGGSM